MGPIARGNKNFTEEYILAKALKNLEKIDVIGLTEELNSMIPQVSVFESINTNIISSNGLSS